jgi:hypothetical protein
MRRIPTLAASLFIGLCLTASFIVHIAADELPASAPYLAFLLLYFSALFTALAYASSRDIFGCSKNRQNRIVENSTYPLDDFGFR